MTNGIRFTEGELQEAVRQLYGAACVELRQARTPVEMEESRVRCQAVEDLVKAWDWNITIERSPRGEGSKREDRQERED